MQLGPRRPLRRNLGFTLGPTVKSWFQVHKLGPPQEEVPSGKIEAPPVKSCFQLGPKKAPPVKEAPPVKSAEASGRRCIGCQNRQPPSKLPPHPNPFFGPLFLASNGYPPWETGVRKRTVRQDQRQLKPLPAGPPAPYPPPLRPSPPRPPPPPPLPPTLPKSRLKP